MKHFKVFNPEHDLALANGSKHFIAPQSIRKMAHDLAPLLEVINCNHPIVWGWDTTIVEQLRRSGIHPKELPTDTALTALRTHSERKTAHDLLKVFRSRHSNDCYEGESRIIRHCNEIDIYANEYEHIILKDPLSSSGKGLRHLATT